MIAVFSEIFNMSTSGAGFCVTTAICRCHRQITQWQCSFHLKAALPLVKTVVQIAKLKQASGSPSGPATMWRNINPCRTELILGNMNISFYFYHFTGCWNLSRWKKRTSSSGIKLQKCAVRVIYGNYILPIRLVSVGFQPHIKDRWLEHVPWNCPHLNATNLTDDWSILVQVTAWCVRKQAITWANVDTVPYRYGTTGPQWVNIVYGI